jgi:formate hydrogenlyase subunit 6/NADH:ubiquinone oxidoreductase subunit I
VCGFVVSACPSGRLYERRHRYGCSKTRDETEYGRSILEVERKVVVNASNVKARNIVSYDRTPRWKMVIDPRGTRT